MHFTTPVLREALLREREREIQTALRAPRLPRTDLPRVAVRLRAVALVARSLRLGVAVERCERDGSAVYRTYV